MNLLVWVMMGIAIWHFAVFVPDRFWGGIVGAFGAAALGRRGRRARSWPAASIDDTSLDDRARGDPRRAARPWRVVLVLRRLRRERQPTPASASADARSVRAAVPSIGR